MSQVMSSFDQFLYDQKRRQQQKLQTTSVQPVDTDGPYQSSFDQFLEARMERRRKLTEQSAAMRTEAARQSPISAGNELGGVATGLGTAGVGLLAPAVRVVSGEAADYLQGQSNAASSAQQQNIEQNVANGDMGETRAFLNRRIAPVTDNLATGFGIGGLGLPALMGAFAGKTFDKSFYDATQKLVPTDKAVQYGVTDAALEVVPMMLFQGLGKLVPGLGGVEDMMVPGGAAKASQALKNIIAQPSTKQAIIQIAKGAVVAGGGELTEESLSTIGQAYSRAATIPGAENSANWIGADGTFATSPMAADLKETAIQTVLMLGASKAITTLTNPKDRAAVIDFAKAGSRRTLAGLPESVRNPLSKLFPNARDKPEERQAAAQQAASALDSIADDWNAPATDDVGQPPAEPPVDVVDQTQVAPPAVQPQIQPQTPAGVPPAVDATQTPDVSVVPSEATIEAPAGPSPVEQRITELEPVVVELVKRFDASDIGADLDQARNESSPEEYLQALEQTLQLLDTADTGSVLPTTPVEEPIVDPLQSTPQPESATPDVSTDATVPQDVSTKPESVTTSERMYDVAAENGTGKRLYLADLRESMPELSRQEFDQALLELEQSGHVVLMPLDNPREIKERDRNAVIPNSAGDARHIAYVDAYKGRPVQSPAETGSMPGGQQAQGIEVAPQTQEPTASQPLVTEQTQAPPPVSGVSPDVPVVTQGNRPEEVFAPDLSQYQSKTKSGTGLEVFGKISTFRDPDILRSDAQPVLDLRKEPTGWLKRDTSSGTILVHPTLDQAIKFESNDRKSGTEKMRAQAEAQAFAVDNPVGESRSNPENPGVTPLSPPSQADPAIVSPETVPEPSAQSAAPAVPERPESTDAKSGHSEPSAERHDAVYRELQQLYKQPGFKSGDRAIHKQVQELEKEIDFHKPAAVARAQAEIDAEKKPATTPVVDGETTVGDPQTELSASQKPQTELSQPETAERQKVRKSFRDDLRNDQAATSPDGTEYRLLSDPKNNGAYLIEATKDGVTRQIGEGEGFSLRGAWARTMADADLSPPQAKPAPSPAPDDAQTQRAAIRAALKVEKEKRAGAKVDVPVSSQPAAKPVGPRGQYALPGMESAAEEIENRDAEFAKYEPFVTEIENISDEETAGKFRDGIRRLYPVVAKQIAANQFSGEESLVEDLAAEIGQRTTDVPASLVSAAEQMVKRAVETTPEVDGFQRGDKVLYDDFSEEGERYTVTGFAMEDTDVYPIIRSKSGKVINADFNDLRLAPASKPRVPDALGPEPKPKSERRQRDDQRVEDADQQVLDALAKFKDKMGRLGVNSGLPVDPEAIMATLELTEALAKAGVVRFQRFVNNVVEFMGEDWVRRNSVYLEEGWSLAAEDDSRLDQPMDIEQLLRSDDGKSTASEESEQSADGEKGRTPEGERGSGTAGQSPADRGGVRDGDGRSDAGDQRQGSVSEREKDSKATGRRSNPDNNEKRETIRVPTGDVRLDPEKVGSGGAKSKYKNNVAAIKLLKELQIEGRKASPDEQQTLSQYVGWGMFPGVFNDVGSKAFEGLTDEQRAEQDPNAWSKERDEIRELLTEEEWQSAADSTINAHFTSPGVVQGMWRMLERMGFTGGRVIETSAGSGNFIGFQPESMKQQSDWTAVEMDKLTGGMLKQLYPSVNTHVMPYQDFAAPDGFYDLAIGNVPFSDKVKVLSDKRYRNKTPNLHDYFFLKTLDKVRPGGLVVFITSTGTLSKQSKNIRTALADKANLVGAFRLPGTTFKKNAGTEVVTDLIIMQRLPDGETATGPAWLELSTLPDPDHGAAIPINEYFKDNPQNILGRLDRKSKLWGPNQPNVSGTDDFEARWEKAIESLPENIMKPWQAPEQKQQVKLLEQGEAKEGQFVSKGGELYVVDNGALVPVPPPALAKSKATNTRRANEYARKKEHVRDIQPVREAVVDRINTMLSGAPAAEVREAKERLNKTYQEFVKQHGPINGNVTVNRTRGTGQVRKSLMNDVDWPLLAALEVWDSDLKKVASLADIFTDDTIRRLERPTTADTLGDAIGFSLNETGGLDLERVGELLGKTSGEVEKQLVADGLGFKDPSAGWVTSSVYLSGNVRQKLREAQLMASSDNAYDVNVSALEKVQPKDIPAEEIYMSPGAPWIPVELTADFVSQLLDTDADNVIVRKLEATGETSVKPANDNIRKGAAATDVWGTNRASFFRLWDVASTGVPIVIRSKNSDGSTYVDQEATEDANAKAEAIKEEFQEWMIADEARRTQVARLYNDSQNNLVAADTDGGHLTFPGMLGEGMMLASENRKFMGLRPHQRNAVWRLIQRGRGLLAHEVGTGKTMTMVASAMELRRLGLARKPAIVVPNSRVNATVREAQDLYPGARILSAAEGMTEKKRRQTVARIATGDYDIVILTHENLLAIPVGPQIQTEYMDRQVEELRSIILEEGVNPDDDGAMKAASSGNRVVKQLRARILKLRERLAELAADRDPGTTFEETGIDTLFVDEAHNFKSVTVNTRMGTVKGIPAGDGSQRANNLDMISTYLTARNNGRGMILATGTPVTNSMAELYVMQNFIQKKELQEAGLGAFDSWANMFGETVTKMEFNHTGTMKTSTRFTKFQNIPELRKLAFQDIDYVRAEDDPVLSQALNRPTRNDREILSPATEAQTQYLIELGRRAEAILGPAEKGGDNHLSIAGDGTKAAMDLRLVMMGVDEEQHSKASKLSAEVLKILEENPDSTQMVFMEKSRSTHTGFDVVHDIIKKLVAGGIPRNKILDFRGSRTPAQKDQMIERLRTGDAIVAIGNTATLGTGVNAQDHVRAIHHFEPSWTPESIEQRNGRGYRQGNGNSELEIITYLSEGTLDQWRWQTVARKDKFIKQLFAGETDSRTMEDEDIDDVGGFERMMILASGNPLASEKMNLDNDIGKLERGQSRFQRQRSRMVGQIDFYKGREARLNERLVLEKELAARYDEHKGTPFKATVGTKEFTDRKEAAEAMARKLIPVKESVGIDKLGTYRGFDIWREGQHRVISNTVVNTIVAVPEGDRVPTEDRTMSWTDSDYLLGDDPTGLFRSLDNQLAGIMRRSESETQTKLKVAGDNRKSLESDYDRPWRSTDKLAKLRSRLAIVDEALAAGLRSTKSLETKKQSERPESPEDVKGRQPPRDDGVLGYGEKSKDGSRPTGRRGAATTAEEQSAEDTGPLSHTAVTKRLEKTWGTIVKAGRVAPGLQGTYAAKPEVIRLVKEQLGDLGLLSHELAHHIDQTTDVLDKVTSRAVKQELRALDYKPGRVDAKVARKEGFAEFLRFWLTSPDTGPSSVMLRAPNMTEYFNDWASKNPDVSKKLTESRALIRRYYNQTAQQRAASQIKDTNEPDRAADESAAEMVAEWMSTTKGLLETDYIDRFAPLQKLVDLAGDNGYDWKKNEESTSYDLLMAFTHTAPQHAQRAAQYGVHFVGEGEQKILGRGLIDIVKDSGVVGGADSDAAKAWMHARFTSDLHADNPEYNSGMMIEDANAILQQTTADDAARYRKLGDGLTEFRNNMLIMLVDAKVLKKEEAQAFISKYPNFMPLVRVFDKGMLKALGSSGLINPGKTVKGRSRKGSDAPIMDPFIATLYTLQKFYNDALHQQVIQQLHREVTGVPGMGSLMHKVIPNRKVQSVRVGDILNDEKVKQEMLMSGIDPALFEDNDELNDAMVRLFSNDMSGNRGENVARVMVNGKPELFWINSDLYEALDSVPHHLAHPIIAMTTAAVRTGAVGLNPVFAAANIQRDWVNFQKQSRYTSGLTTMVSPFYWVGKYIAHTLPVVGKENEMSKLYQEWGGLLATRFGKGHDSVVDIRDNELGLFPMKDTRSLTRKVGGKLKRAGNRIQGLIAIADVGPRLAEFAGALRSHGYVQKGGKIIEVATGKPKQPPRHVIIEAINAAGEATVNFKQRGRKTMVADQYVAFLGASIASANKAYRAAKGAVTGDPSEANQLKYIIASASIAALTVYYTMLRSGDDDYEEEDDRIKYGYWNFSWGGQTLFRFSKGYEDSFLPNVVEGIINSMKSGSLDDFYDAMWQSFSKVMIPHEIAAIDGPLEVFANYDKFRQAPIENTTMQSRKTVDRERPWTSELAKAISRFGGQYIGLSPVEIEHLLDKQTGGLGTKVVKLAEGAGEAVTGGGTQKLSEGVARLQPLAGFMVNRNTIKSVDTVYDRQTELSEEVNSLRYRGGTPSEAQKAEQSRLRRVTGMFSQFRELVQEERDRDKRFDVEKYIGGLARWATGQDELKLYPNPLRLNDLPAGVKAIVEEELTKAIVRGSVRTESKDPEYLQSVDNARSFLKESGITKGQALRLLTLHFRSEPRVNDSYRNEQNRQRAVKRAELLRALR
jgi:N12 class adenine-specific DNA methylase